ncbi:phosphoheptose isomerase [Bacteroidia bacterium]|nr:phosphoheptose isomerase [Bacteroidia bacterium]
MSSIDLIREDFAEARQALDNFCADTAVWERIEAVGLLLAGVLCDGGKIITCGNGGSHCDAMHFAEELSGRYRLDRQPLGALCISDPSHISCVANDFGYEQVFARYIEAVGRSGDALTVFTSSGRSANLVQACRTARAKGMKVVGLTGKDGGEVAPLCDMEIRIAWQGYADRIQELHGKLVHTLIHFIENELGV